MEAQEFLLLCTLMSLLALGYTMPPLKLSWRGLAETDVGIRHSIAVMLMGFVFQGGNLLPLPINTKKGKVTTP